MNFNKIVHEILGATFARYDLKLNSERDDYTHYLNKDIQIIIAYDSQLSYEVSISFIIEPFNETYSLTELLKVKNEPSEFAFQTNEEKRMYNCLEKAKKLLCELIPSLLNSPMDFRTALEESRTKLREFEKIKWFERNIEKCWVAKDYAGIVELMKSHEGPVLESTRKKISIAMKKAKPKT